MQISQVFISLPLSEPADSPPKTFTTKDKFEYFKPCVQVEMENQDKPDTVTEFFIRGVYSSFLHVYHYIVIIYI